MASREAADVVSIFRPSVGFVASAVIAGKAAREREAYPGLRELFHEVNVTRTKKDLGLTKVSELR
jgi:hypothetical protein